LAGRPKGPSMKIQQRMVELSGHLATGLTVAEAAEKMGLRAGQADYCAELLHQHLLEDAIVNLDDVPTPAPPEEIIRYWQDRAACRGYSELFFGPDGEYRADRLVREAKAATLCRSCPVLEECLDTAAKTSALGWWGGMSETERKICRRARRQPAAA
jgi:WhiB family transcriptional regulator, redox-sensing transcriptional regulator